MPLPKGYTLDTPQTTLPAGYTLDAPAAPSAAGLAPGQSLPGVPKAPLPAGLQGPPTPPSALSNAADVAGNFGKGIAKGGMGTFLNIAQMGNDVRQWEHQHLPDAGAAFRPPGQASDQDNNLYVQNLQKKTVPHGTAQTLGKGTEQVGEFMVPGLGEEAATAKLAALGPKAGIAARMLYGAGTSGLVNKAQGGSFAGGAAAGAIGSGVSEGLKSVAPLIAESALGVRAADRAYDRQVGQAILGETTGLNAGNIAKQAQGKLSLYGNQLTDLASKSPNLVDLTPSRQIAQDAATEAAVRNNPDTIRRTGQLNDLLNKSNTTSALIPPQVPASQALGLKRGLGELAGSWNPATPNTFAEGATKGARSVLDTGIDNAVPGSQQLNEKLSVLDPVAKRAGATDLNASALQRIMGRLTKPTGALLPAAAGAGYGYHKDGAAGAALYGLAGFAAPEIIGSPTVQMGVARAANSALLPPTVRALTGTGLQATRKKSLYDAP